MDGEKLVKDCETRAIIFDGADAMFLAQHERECAKVIKNLLDRAKSAEVRAETLEKMVKEYQDEIVPGYREQVEKAERERDEEKLKVDEYTEAARAIALWLSAFCDKSLSYPQMISNAVRKISAAYADMEKRAECAEARIRELETQHRTEMCEAGYDCVQLGKERKSAEHERQSYEEQGENLKRALAAMWFAYQNKDAEMPHDFEFEAVEKARELLGEWSECMTKYLRESGAED